MELKDVVKEIYYTSPEDAKMTLSWIIAYMSEKDGWEDIIKAYKSSPYRDERPAGQA